MTRRDAGRPDFFPLCAHLQIAVSLCTLKCTHILMALVCYGVFGVENSPVRVKVENTTRHHIKQQCFQNFSLWPECKHFPHKQCGDDIITIPSGPSSFACRNIGTNLASSWRLVISNGETHLQL